MVVAAGTAVCLLLGVEPLELGLPGVWYALGLLMVSRLATMVWRYQSEDGPLPPSAALAAQQQQLLAAASAAVLSGGSAVGSMDGADAGSSNDSNGSSSASSSGYASGSSVSVALLSADDLAGLSNNAVEAPVPQQGAAWREAGRAGPPR